MKNGRLVALLAGIAVAAAIELGPVPDGLTEEGQSALAVAALCLIWWVFDGVALPVTSLAGLALLPLLGALPASEALALFGNQAVFFVIGVFLIAAVMMQTGLSSWIALHTMRRLAKTEDSLCTAVLFLSWALCTVVVSHAVAALMLPLVLEIIRALGLKPGSNTARRLLLSMAWGTISGSNLTLLSSARASLTLEIYEKFRAGNSGHAGIHFLQFTEGTAVVALASMLVAAVVLRLAFPPEGIDPAPAIRRLDERVRQLGGITRPEWITIVVIAGMVAAMVVWGREVGLGTIALLASVALFGFRILSWEDAERYVNWGVALMFGGAIAVGAALDRTGAMAWVVDRVLPVGSVSPWLVWLSAGAMSALLTEVVSNSAVIALLLPASLEAAGRVGLDPRGLTLLLPLCAGFAFVLPTSTPAMAMVFGTGYIRIRDTLVPGLMLLLLSLLALVATALLVWPFAGFQAVIEGGP